MTQLTGGIVKKNDVRDAPDGPAEVRARLVERGPTGAVIEVTCTCGRTIRLKADYAPPGQ